MPRPAARPPARKPESTVTRAFLFSDLRGYTDFVEARGDAAAAALLRRYRELIRREFARHHGAEVKTEGDSFYLVFESALAALECAVGIHRGAHAHNQAEPGAPLRIGIGLHVGETVPYDDQFVGGAVNVAARLASKAKAGELLVSDTLRGLVRTGQRYRMEDRGPLKLKGVAERLRAWSVEWREEAPVDAVPTATPPLPASTPRPRPAPVPGQIVCPIVVGREAHVTRVAEHLALAASGQGQTVIVSGEAGVGKSAFVREATAEAGRREFRVLYGATLESDGGLPYAPFVAAVRSGFRGLERDRLGRVLAQAAPDLAQLFPELGRAARQDGGASVEQHRLSVAFHGLFTAFAREAPVVVVVEDLHWSDEASLGLLHYLARELRDARILLLASYRSDEMHRRHPLLRVLAGMQRERVVSEISLGRLTREQVGELIRATFAPTHPTVRVSAEFRDAIYDRSEGNPFFTEELLKSLVESGDLYYTPENGWDSKPIDQLRIPGSVREAVRARVERLSPEAQTTLSAAAAIGLRFPFEVLRDVHRIAEAELEAHLREFIEQQLVVELGGQGDDYGFRHALTKEVVYDDLLVRERKRLHRGVADVLVKQAHAEPALIAHHLIAAGETAAAVPYLLDAAARAFRAFAPREAAAHYVKAVEIGVPEERLGPTPEALAEAYHLFDFALSRKAAEDAAALYRERGEVRGASRMLRLASRSTWQQGDPTRAGVLAQEAIGILGDLEETVELGQALVNLAALRMLARADEEAVSLSDRALAIGARFGDDWTTAHALITKGTSLGVLGQGEAGRELIVSGRDRAIASRLAEVALRGYNNLLVGSIFLLDPAERERVLQEGIAYAQQHGVEQPMLLAGRAFAAYLRGDWDEALAAADRVPGGSVWHDSVVLGARAGIALGREGPAAALAIVRDRAEGASRHTEAQRFVGPVAQMALTCAFADDRVACEGWLARIRERAAVDRGIVRQLSFGPGWGLLPAAAYCGQPDWVDLIAAVLPNDEESAMMRRMLEAMRAFFAADAGVCGRAIAEVYRLSLARRLGASPSIVLLLGRELRRRGIALGPEWQEPIAMVREHSGRAGARWFLAELDQIASP